MLTRRKLTVYGLQVDSKRETPTGSPTFGESSLQKLNRRSDAQLLFSKAAFFSAEEVIRLLEEEMDEPMCEGNDDELGMVQETEDDK